jgi:anti-sigma B factor antagonist
MSATPAAGFTCVSHEDGRGTSTIVISGELDAATVTRAERELDRAEGRSTAIVLDLRRMTFIDSSGLQLIGDADARIRAAGGRLVLIRPPKHVDRVFQITRMSYDLEFVDEPPNAAPAPEASAPGGAA